MNKFGEWLPDRPVYDNPGLYVADNVISAEQGYLPMPGRVVEDTVIVPGALGSDIEFTHSDTTLRTYAFTAAFANGNGMIWDIFQRQDVSPLGSDIQPFTGFGFFQGKMLAIAGYPTGLHSIVPEQARFAKVTGGPYGACIGIIGDHVVIGNAFSDVTTGSWRRVHWSGYQNETQWTPAQNGSDFEDLDGTVTKIVSGKAYGLVFTTKSIWRMTPAPSPIWFSFERVATNYGTSAGRSVVAYGDSVFFLSNSGFYALDNGSTLRPIGEDKVDRLVTDKKELMRQTIGAPDFHRNMIAWSIVKDTEATPNRDFLLYNIVTGRWSMIAGGNQYQWPVLIERQQKLDSKEYTLGAFLNTKHLVSFSGPPMTASLITGEWGGSSRMSITSVRPYVEGDASTRVRVSLGLRDSMTSEPVWTEFQDLNAVGEAIFRKNARYARVWFQISGGFKHAHGYDVEFKADGKR